MTDAIKQSLRDKPAVRWTALILVAATMFFAYMFVDVLSPLKTQLEQQVNWSSTVFGSYGSSEFFINVFFGFLILAGIILDRMGVRFTAILSGSLMLLGALIKVYALSEVFNGGGFGYDMLNSFSMAFPPSAKLACVGFAIFGCGCEMAGVTVSRAIVKWFHGPFGSLRRVLDFTYHFKAVRRYASERSGTGYFCYGTPFHRFDSLCYLWYPR